jgi:ABC-type arginine transport system permease subunit
MPLILNKLALIPSVTIINLLKPSGYGMHQSVEHFNNYTLYRYCIYAFCIFLRTNSDLCHLHLKKLIGFYYSAVRTGDFLRLLKFNILFYSNLIQSIPVIDTIHNIYLGTHNILNKWDGYVISTCCICAIHMSLFVCKLYLLAVTYGVLGN